MDFFTVPTLSFGQLYCFFVVAHDRRRILSCSVTKHPTSAWVIQQLREAFPYDSRRVLRRVIKEPNIPMQVVGSYPCQDLAGCITATI
jgi:hypothetical protein